MEKKKVEQQRVEQFHESERLETCCICKKELSHYAESCPHCGDPKFRGSTVDGCTTVIARGGCALVLLYAVVSALLSSLFKGCGG